MATPESVNEQQVEATLRPLLLSLDRWIEWSYISFGLGLILACPALFFLLWLAFDFRWWAALAWAGGAAVLVVVCGLSLEAVLLRRTVRRFDREFPFGSLRRAVAVQVLGEMQTPNEAAEKLQEYLPETAITRHPPADVEQQLDDALNPAPAPRPEAPGGTAPESPPRLDYIPLELPPPDPEEPPQG